MDVLAEMTDGSGGAQYIFLAGLALVIIILLMRSRRYFRQVTQLHTPTARPPRAANRAKIASTSSAPPPDYDKWEVSMHELARDLSGQLDTKIRVLELLIREADEAARRLEAAVKGHGAGGKGQEERGQGPGASGQGLQKPRLAPDATVPLGASPPQKFAPSKPTSESKKPLKIAGNPRFERVYALADAGMSTATIANQIGSQVGEVELILSLRGTRPA